MPAGRAPPPILLTAEGNVTCFGMQTLGMSHGILRPDSSFLFFFFNIRELPVNNPREAWGAAVLLGAYCAPSLVLTLKGPFCCCTSLIFYCKPSHNFLGRYAHLVCTKFGWSRESLHGCNKQHGNQQSFPRLEVPWAEGMRFERRCRERPRTCTGTRRSPSPCSRSCKRGRSSGQTTPCTCRSRWGPPRSRCSCSCRWAHQPVGHQINTTIKRHKGETRNTRFHHN